MSRNASASQMSSLTPSTNMFDPMKYSESVPDQAQFGGVKRATSVQPLSAGNRTSISRETAWSTTQLKQESPVSYSKQTRGSLFSWDDDASSPATVQSQQPQQ